MFLYLPSIQKAFQFHALFFGQNSFNTARKRTHLLLYKSDEAMFFIYSFVFFVVYASNYSIRFL